MRYTFPATVLAVLCLAQPAAAQPPATVVVVEHAPIYGRPDAMRQPLRVAAAGTVLRVVESLEPTPAGWYRVEFQDPQWGRRVGFVQADFVQAAAPGDSHLQPMDLSVPEAAAPSVPSEPEYAPVTLPRPTLQGRFEMRQYSGYVLGRSGVTFGTIAAPLAGVEVGGAVTPWLVAYGAFDWHQDIATDTVQEVADFISDLVGLDVEYEFPAYMAMGGIKAGAPAGAVRPYGLGGFGLAHIRGRAIVEGSDVTELLESQGFLESDEVNFTKPVFEVGAGIMVPAGRLVIDVGYRFRKLLDTGESIDISGLYAGAGVRF